MKYRITYKTSKDFYSADSMQIKNIDEDVLGARIDALVKAGCVITGVSALS